MSPVLYSPVVVVAAEDLSLPGEAGDGVVEGVLADDAAQAAGVPLALHRPKVEAVVDGVGAARAGHLACVAAGAAGAHTRGQAGAGGAHAWGRGLDPGLVGF